MSASLLLKLGGMAFTSSAETWPSRERRGGGGAAGGARRPAGPARREARSRVLRRRPVRQEASPALLAASGSEWAVLPPPGEPDGAAWRAPGPRHRERARSRRPRPRGAKRRGIVSKSSVGF